MAIDEALLRSFDPFSSRPVLRLYGWEPAALSLGRFQAAGDVLNLPRCRNERVAVVRRITGGGVIYHADELTYSIVCSPDQIPPAASIKDSFRVLTAFLIAFYRRLGLEAGYAVDASTPGERLGERTGFCFAGRESYDILVQGRKIGGNAQRRLKSVIFQHGSIPLADRVPDGLSYLREQPPNIVGTTTCLGALGIADEQQSLQRELSDSFADTFNVALHSGGLTAEEAEAAACLLQDKYESDAWNLEGSEA